MTEKQMRVLSVVATLTAVGMYVSYIPQIQNNLAGNPGSPLQPLVAAINCTLNATIPSCWQTPRVSFWA